MAELVKIPMVVGVGLDYISRHVLLLLLLYKDFTFIISVMPFTAY